MELSLSSLSLASSSSSTPSLLHERPHESSSSRKELPEDILFDIFLRVGYRSILKCKRVSKVWHSVISDPIFINKWFRKYRRFDTCVPWIVINSIFEFYKPNGKILPSIAAPNNHIPFFSIHDGLNFKFIYGIVGAFNGTEVDILGSSNGLVLCQYTICPEYPWILGRNLSECRKIYYVCNPLTEKFMKLPQPSQTNIAGHCIITCEPSIASITSSTVTVVRIPAVWTPSKAFDLEIYSSCTRAWETRNVSCPPGTTICPIYRFHRYLLDVVTHKGVLYWISGEDSQQIMTIDLKNDKGKHGGYECKVLHLPVDHPWNGCLGAPPKGPLCYCSISKTNYELNLWELRLVENSMEESNEEKWDWYLVYRDMYLSGMYLDEPIALNPLDRDIVLLSDDKVYTIRTRRIEKLTNPFMDGEASHRGCRTYNRIFYWKKYWEYKE